MDVVSAEIRKINVLQLVEGLSWGGAEGKLLELINHMDPNRFNTILCSLGLGDNIKEKVEESGVNFLTLPRKTRLDFNSLFKLVKLIKNKRIDIVMTTLFYADVIGAVAGKLAGVKAIFSWETVSAPEWLIKRRLWPYRFTIRYCDRIISVSQATAKFLVEKRGVPENKVVVIPYGVNDKEYVMGSGKAVRKSLGLNVDDFIIGTVGRLHPQKGHKYLFEAAKILVQQYPQVRFLLVGDGEIKQELEDLVKNMNLQSNVLFLGYCTNVKDLLKAFDIFTLPSLYEGLPNAVLEAMAVGKPVVASAVDGILEAVVNGVTGLLVSPGNPEELKDAFIKLINNRELAKQMGENGRKRVENVFLLDKQVEAFQNLYEEYYLRSSY